MGYKRVPKQYRLRFEDPDMTGFVCVAKSVSVDEFVTMTDAAAALASGTGADLGVVFGMLANSIVEWNLEDDTGTVCEISEKILRAQDIEFVLTILTGWMSAIASVAPPLPASSNSGGTSPEVSQQLANLSRSLPNS